MVWKGRNFLREKKVWKDSSIKGSNIKNGRTCFRKWENHLNEDILHNLNVTDKDGDIYGLTEWWLRVGEPQEEGYDVDNSKFSLE